MSHSHPFDPVFDAHARVLVLGTFPSVKSRETAFYYGHPQNRFWRVLARVFEGEIPVTIPEKKRFLQKNGVALWDVVASCDIDASSDASIRNAAPNDVSRILRAADIRAVYANGATAEKLYNRLLFPLTGREITRLPSTSPANCRVSIDALVDAWRVLRQT